MKPLDQTDRCIHMKLSDASDSEIIAEAKSRMSRKLRRGVDMNSPTRAVDYLHINFGHLPYEVFGLIHLDARRRLIAVEPLNRGTVAGANVYPREVVRSVMAHNSASVILFHNHPSGDPAPSDDDITLTEHLKVTLQLIDVRVLDHLIIGSDGTYHSFGEHGHI